MPRRGNRARAMARKRMMRNRGTQEERNDAYMRDEGWLRQNRVDRSNEKMAHDMAERAGGFEKRGGK